MKTRLADSLVCFAAVGRRRCGPLPGRLAVVFLLGAGAWLTSGAPAQAANRTWASGANGKWETPTNWSPTGSPTNTDTINITASGNYTVTIDDTTADTGDATTWMQVQGLVINDTGGTATLSVNFTNATRSLLIETNLAAYLQIGNVAGSRGVFSLQNGTVVSSSFQLGGTAGAYGEVDVSGGTLHQLAASMFIGYDTLGTGVVSVTGGQLLDDTSLQIGYSGVGFLTVSNGLVSTPSAVLGANTFGGNGAVGVWNIYGGTNNLTATSAALTLGGANGASGSILVAGGVLNATNNATASATVLGNVAGGSGTMQINGGAFNAALLEVGNAGTGTLTVNGGVLNAYDLEIGYGTGTGSVTFTAGTITGSGITVGNGGRGSLVINGGQLTEASLWVGKSAPGSLAIHGGTNNLTTVNATDFLVGYAAPGSATIDGGLTIATNGYTFIGYGDLGTVTMSGGEYRGQTMYLGNSGVGAGTWTLSGGTVTASGVSYIGNSAVGTLNVQGGTYAGSQIYVGSGTGSTGSILVSGGTLTASSGSTSMRVGDNGVGQLVVQGGTVQAVDLSISYGTGSGSVWVKGGQLNTSGRLSVGVSSAGAMTVSNGMLLVDDLWVGNGAPGTVTIYGGTNNFTAPAATELLLGFGTSGTLTMNGGVLLATNGATYVGYSGPGNFTVSNGQVRVKNITVGGNSGSVGLWNIVGGTNIVSGSLTVGANAGANGSVVVSGNGLLEFESTAAIAFANAGAPSGITNQNGGTLRFDMNNPTVSYFNPSSQINVNGGVIEFKGVDNAALGTFLPSLFYQGNNTLSLNSATNANLSTYAVSNGASFATLRLTDGTTRWQSGFTTIGSGGTLLVTNTQATLTGVFTNSGTVKVVNSAATFTGKVVNNGAWISDPSTVSFLDDLTVSATGSISMSAGDTYVFAQSFRNSSTHSNSYDTTAGRFLFSGGGTQVFASAGRDLGPGPTPATPEQQLPPFPAGFSNNFALGTLELSNFSTVKVTDAFLGQVGDARAGLYLDQLLLGSGSWLIIDTNVTVYFIGSNNWAAAGAGVFLVGDAELHQLVPEPSLILLAACGAGLLGWRRHRRDPRR